MAYTREQIQNVYRKLPPKIQDFVMDSETTDLISEYLKEVGLSEEQAEQADSEILYAMLGLQSLYDAIGNIAKLSNKPTKELVGLKSSIEKNIFSKIPTNSTAQTEFKPQNNVGGSFEQTILNQARAMQPAIPPENLPTESNEPNKVPNYRPGEDPYREPAE